MFLKELSKQLNELENHIQSSDSKAAHHTIHKIRGSCKTCGADELDNKLSLLGKDINTDNFREVLTAANAYKTVLSKEIVLKPR